MQTEPEKPYFSSTEKVFFILFLCLGIGFRFALLDLRPIHHDESLYASYSYYFYLDPIGKFYRYNPLLHGPFLFNFLPWIYDSLGISTWTIRFPSAVIGSVLLFFPYLFRKYLNKAAVLIFTLVLAMSPSLIYWSKYLRHDPFLIMSLMGLLFGMFLAPRKYKLIISLACLSIAFCIKENIYVTIAMLLGFLVFDSIYHKQTSPLITKTLSFIKENSKQAFFALGVFIFIYVYFYTSGFSYKEGILDGIYRKSLSYWFQQHSIERLKGPFSFSFLFLSWYEQLFMALAFVQYFYSYLHFPKKFRYATLLSLISSFIIYGVYKFHLPFRSFFIWEFLKMKMPLDVFVLLIIVSQSFILPIFHQTKKDRTLAFWSYFYFASFFTYSYLGEKVPWLTLYILIPGLIYYFLYFKNTLQSFYEGLRTNNLHCALAFLLILLQLRFLTMTNFGLVNKDSELVRQVHTTKNFEKLVKYIKTESLIYPETRVLSLNATTWPLAWYFRDNKNYRFFKNNEWDLNSYDYIFDEEKNKDKYKELEKDFTLKKFPFRSWWVPDYNNLNIKNYFRYAFFHSTWNKPGMMNIIILEKN